jgi:type IV pilus assembly protein PilA
MKRAKGFSLIELLIVVAIILIIAAIAIPNLLRSRMAANEASAVGTLRSISTANATYANTYNIGYAGDLNYLGPPASGTPDSTHADVLDSTVSGIAGGASNTAIKSGYVFTYAAPSATPTPGIPNTSFTTVGVPIAIDNTGTSTYCVDQTNVILKDITIGGGHTTASGNGCVVDGWTGATVAPI